MPRIQTENVLLGQEEDQSLNIIKGNLKRSQTLKSEYQSKYLVITDSGVYEEQGKGMIEMGSQKLSSKSFELPKT